MSARNQEGHLIQIRIRGPFYENLPRWLVGQVTIFTLEPLWPFPGEGRRGRHKAVGRGKPGSRHRRAAAPEPPGCYSPGAPQGRQPDFRSRSPSPAWPSSAQCHLPAGGLRYQGRAGPAPALAPAAATPARNLRPGRGARPITLMGQVQRPGPELAPQRRPRPGGGGGRGRGGGERRSAQNAARARPQVQPALE